MWTLRSTRPNPCGIKIACCLTIYACGTAFANGYGKGGTQIEAKKLVLGAILTLGCASYEFAKKPEPCAADGGCNPTYDIVNGSATHYSPISPPSYHKTQSITFQSDHRLTVKRTDDPNDCAANGGWSVKNGWDGGVVVAQSGTFSWSAGEVGNKSLPTSAQLLTGSTVVSTPGTYVAYAKTVWQNTTHGFDSHNFTVIS